MTSNLYNFYQHIFLPIYVYVTIRDIRHRLLYVAQLCIHLHKLYVLAPAYWLGEWVFLYMIHIVRSCIFPIFPIFSVRSFEKLTTLQKHAVFQNNIKIFYNILIETLILLMCTYKREKNLSFTLNNYQCYFWNNEKINQILEVKFNM